MVHSINRLARIDVKHWIQSPLVGGFSHYWLLAWGAVSKSILLTEGARVELKYICWCWIYIFLSRNWSKSIWTLGRLESTCFGRSRSLVLKLLLHGTRELASAKESLNFGYLERVVIWVISELYGRVDIQRSDLFCYLAKTQTDSEQNNYFVNNLPFFRSTCNLQGLESLVLRSNKSLDIVECPEGQ